MNIDATIKVLSNERACVVRQTEGGCDRKCDGCDLVLPDRMILSAYGTAISILLSQQEKEKNEPLTLEELNNMDGQPVWITPGGFWALVYAREGERTILVSNDREGVFADKEIELVGPVYRRPPEEGQT